MFGTNRPEGATIESVHVTTNGNLDVVSPGQQSRQSVEVWVYPELYSRRIEVEAQIDGETSPLHYRTLDGQLSNVDRRSKDVLLGGRAAVRRQFDFDIEHAVADGEVAPATHGLTTRARTAALIESGKGLRTALYSLRDSKQNSVQCRSTP